MQTRNKDKDVENKLTDTEEKRVGGMNWDMEINIYTLLLLLLLSRFSRVQLLATPWTAAYQVPPSMGFPRQEYWSEVPSPSPHTHYYIKIDN